MSCLYVVATPIGCLADLSPRARSVLAEVSLVAAEDTRVARSLYRSLGLTPPELWSCHDHNEAARAGRVVERIGRGEPVALVSDAGTPLVSDPGYRVVRAVIDAGLPVVPVPGPSAPLAALVASGLPTDRFLFAGFPPSKPSRRRTWLEGLARHTATLVLFESPKRILQSLEACQQVLGDRPCCLAISLTKEWERFHRGTLSEVRERLVAEPDEVIGEMCLCLAGAEDAGGEVDERWWTVIDGLAAAGVSPSVIRNAVAGPLGLKARDVYQRALGAAEPNDSGEG